MVVWVDLYGRHTHLINRSDKVVQRELGDINGSVMLDTTSNVCRLYLTLSSMISTTSGNSPTPSAVTAYDVHSRTKADCLTPLAYRADPRRRLGPPELTPFRDKPVGLKKAATSSFTRDRDAVAAFRNPF
jgi:hypothetical protein